MATPSKRQRIMKRMQEKMKQNRMLWSSLGMFGLLLAVVLLGGYILGWSWTGFGPYLSPAHRQGTDFQRGKTLWDWLQLLFIPIVLAAVGTWFSRQQSQTQEKIATRRQYDQTLQTYIDNMSKLLLEQYLLNPPEGSAVREVARAQTMAVLWRLGPTHKGALLQFLHEADLINKPTSSARKILDPVIPLGPISAPQTAQGVAELRVPKVRTANLREANLKGADLHDAYLSMADLRRANLSGADLSGANLSGADLSGADLSATDLSRADLRRAKVTTNQLKQAKSLVDAMLPDELKPS